MQTSSGKFWALPATRLGWWAVGLAMASFLLGFLWLFLPGGALLGFLCGLVGGILALIAVISQHERSWLVFLSILPMFNVFIFILGEVLIPH
jgi:ascorbate-specific PTS system EIIC-type component UlaA